MHRSVAPETSDVAPGTVLLSTIVGVTLATGCFAIGLGTTGIAEGSTSFWYLSRASGFVACCSGEPWCGGSCTECSPRKGSKPCTLVGRLVAE